MDDGNPSGDDAEMMRVLAPEVATGLPALFRGWARYNRVANERLYAACAEVDDAALRRDTDASLGSILAILEHVLAADRIWMARLEGEGATTPKRGLLEPTFEALLPLRRERERLDAAIESFFASAGPQFFAGEVRSVDSRGREARDPVPLAATHMFNHQTHHRGQAHALLRGARPKSLTLDMHRILAPLS